MAVWRATWTITDSVLGGIGTNTWHARTTADPPSPEVGIALDALNGDLGVFYTAIQDIFHGGAVIHFNGEWVRVDDDSQTIHRGDTNDLAVGGTTDAMPPANCLVVGWGTSVASKSGRGRTFLGPLRTSVNQDNGTPLETVRTEVEAAAADFIDSFDGFDGGAFGVWSVKDQVLRDFTDGRVANRFAVLRSRRD